MLIQKKWKQSFIINLFTNISFFKPNTQGIFIFSCVWSFGASIDNKGREFFDQFLRELLSGPMSLELKEKYNILDMVDGPARPYLCPFPSKGNVYDYRFIKEVHFIFENNLFILE